MKAVVQRVQWAEVEVNGQMVGSIRLGLLVYVAVGQADDAACADRMAEKVANLRVFEDDDGKLNLSVQDVRGGILAVPNFTLLADARKGRRPAFSGAAGPEIALSVYDAFVLALKKLSLPVAKGVFGADMTIRSAAIGPVNIILDMPPSGNGGEG